MLCSVLLFYSFFKHAKSHMRSIQKQPEKIKALFHKESVKYAG